MNKSIGLIVVIVSLLVTGRTEVKAQRVAASQPATRPAGWPTEPYLAAGVARRAAGVETWMFIHPTWINWRPGNFTSPYARELVDGYLLIMIDGRRDLDLDAGVKAASFILGRGMRLVPGMRLGPDREYKEWTEPLAWAKDLVFYRSIRKQFARGPALPLVVDMEPYWDKGPRLPRADDVYAMTEAMGPWLDAVKSKDLSELWILPGGIHYWGGWVLGTVRAPHGRVLMLDEGTYSRSKGDDAKLAVMIRQRANLMNLYGIDYVPGFNLRHAIDPTLYETLEQCGIKRCWFYCNAKEDQWEEFGTMRWKHRQ